MFAGHRVPVIETVLVISIVLLIASCVWLVVLIN